MTNRRDPSQRSAGRTDELLAVVRASHDRLASIVASMSDEDLARPSACTSWTVAEVLSHLGSQAEIFSRIVDAGLEGREAPGRAQFEPIWDEWNARSSRAQADEMVVANESLVARLETLEESALESFSVELFGAERDVDAILLMRVSEHSLHTWDVAVALDPSAEVAPDAVAVLLDELSSTAARSGRPAERPARIVVSTSTPARRFLVETGDPVRLEPIVDDAPGTPSVTLPSEALVRLVYGRLDDAHPARGAVREDGVELAELVAAFPGF